MLIEKNKPCEREKSLMDLSRKISELGKYLGSEECEKELERRDELWNEHFKGTFLDTSKKPGRGRK